MKQWCAARKPFWPSPCLWLIATSMFGCRMEPQHCPVSAFNLLVEHAIDGDASYVSRHLTQPLRARLDLAIGEGGDGSGVSEALLGELGMARAFRCCDDSQKRTVRVRAFAAEFLCSWIVVEFEMQRDAASNWLLSSGPEELRSVSERERRLLRSGRFPPDFSCRPGLTTPTS